jgi:hypothetical protein
VDLQTSEVLGRSTLPLWTENARKIAELFPDVVIGGKIDFDRLRTELSGEIFENRSGAYDFTWVGKGDAVRELHRSIDKTLRSVIDDSKNWETTENLYIEGDNLESAIWVCQLNQSIIPIVQVFSHTSRRLD